MKKLVAIAALAVVLGVAVVLAPLMTLTYYYHTTTATDSTGLRAGSKDEALPSVQEAANATSLATLDEAAKTYGGLDAGPTPFPSSLLPVTVIVATGLAAALGVSLYIRTRI